jgi:hypothetical protein
MRIDNVQRSIGTLLRIFGSVTLTVNRASHRDMVSQWDADDSYVLLHLMTNSLRGDEASQASPQASHEATQSSSASAASAASAEEVQALRDELARMKAIVEDMVKHNNQSMSSGLSGLTNIHVVDNSSHTTNNTYVVINDFGKEDLSYMHVPEELLAMRNNGVIKAINQIHFNDAHVENQNVRLKSAKKALVEVVEGGKWTQRCMVAVKEEMIKKAFRMITHKYVTDEAYRKIIVVANGEGLMEWVMKMLSLGHENQTVMVPIRRDLEALLVSKRPAQGAPQKAIA